jgi:hypothetical protein
MHGSDDNRSIASTEVRVPEYIDMNNKNKVLTYNKQQKLITKILKHNKILKNKDSIEKMMNEK